MAVRSSISEFFSQLISSNKRNPKILFETINSVVSPMVPPVAMSSVSDSNDFLNLFVDKVNNVQMSVCPSIPSVCVSGPPPPHSLLVFNPMTIHDLSLLLDKMKITTCPYDILPAGLFSKCSLCHWPLCCRDMQHLSFNRCGA